MINFTKILIDGTILAGIGSLYLLAMLWFNPRLSLNDLPDDIKNAVPPWSKKEKIQAILFGIPFFILVIGFPFFSTLALKNQYGGNISLFALFINAFGVIMIFNIVEVGFVDLLLLCKIRPKFMIIPGTERLAGSRDYWHQIRAHLRGTVLMGVLCVIIAGVVYFI